MDRCALFVDAGYLLADGAMAAHGTRNREAVAWDYPGLMQLLASLARERTGLPLLRCYWYEATVEGLHTPDHDTLADIPGLKLRLARIRPGRREGVDAQVHRDLMTLARNTAICDAVVVSGDEDLAQVICDAQDLGIRITVVSITADANWAVSRALRKECDDLIEVAGAHLRPYVSLVTGAEAGMAVGNGQQSLSNGQSRGGHALTSGGQALTMGSQAQAAAGQPLTSAGQSLSSQALGPDVQFLTSAGQSLSSHTLGPGVQSLTSAGQSLGAGSQAHGPNAQAAMTSGGQSLIDGPQTHGYNAQPMSAGGQSVGGGSQGFGSNAQSISPGGQSVGGGSQGFGSNAQPMSAGGESVGGGFQGQGGNAQSLTSAGQSLSGGLQALGPGPQSSSSDGQPSNGSHAMGNGSHAMGNGSHAFGNGRAASAPQALPPASSPPLPPSSPPPARSAPPALSAYPGYALDPQPSAPPQAPTPSPPPAPPQGITASSPPPSQPAHGSYAQMGPFTGPQPAPVSPASSGPGLGGATTLADAVKAAHKEGHDFGESVARDAPALWLEAVLARKPRMPSDLEARLLQGSSLPIDFLLHDEVRHALRRGFWDALEHARR